MRRATKSAYQRSILACAMLTSPGAAWVWVAATSMWSARQPRESAASCLRAVDHAAVDHPQVADHAAPAGDPVIEHEAAGVELVVDAAARAHRGGSRPRCSPPGEACRFAFAAPARRPGRCRRGGQQRACQGEGGKGLEESPAGPVAHDRLGPFPGRGCLVTCRCPHKSERGGGGPGQQRRVGAESISMRTSPTICSRSGWRTTTRATGAGGAKRWSS